MILQGDSLDILKTLQPESVNCCMTSPPYWALRDYGVDGQLGLEPTFTQYINKLCDIFDEVKRVLRKDGTLWVNIGDTYYSPSTQGSNDGRQGFQSNAESNFIHTAGNGKCLICGKDTPKQFCSKDCLNKRGNNFRSQNRILPSKSLCNIPARFSIEMQNRGWILRNVIIWHKPNCMPSSVKDRFTVDFEYLYFFVKSKKYWFEQQLEPVKQVLIERMGRGLCGSKHEKFRIEKNGQQEIKKEERMDKDRWCNDKGRNKRTVWDITLKGYSGAHFATYPEALCETPLRAGCPVGGIVLDPFCGAGTTGLVALKQNKQFIGIELNPEYIKIAEKRLEMFK